MTTCNIKKLCYYDSWHFVDVKVMFVTIFTHKVWPYLAVPYNFFHLFMWAWTNIWNLVIKVTHYKEKKLKIFKQWILASSMLPKYKHNFETFLLFSLTKSHYGWSPTQWPHKFGKKTTPCTTLIDIIFLIPWPIVPSSRM